MESRQVFAINPSGNVVKVFLFGEPDKCILCNSTVVHPASAFLNSETVYRLSRCTGAACGKINMLVYTYVDHPTKGFHYGFSEQQVSVPLPSMFPEITEPVARMSPQFVEIYGQALATDQLRLTQVTGLALRKALEFLVKDYSVAHYPEDRDAIGKKPMSSCIEDYIKDPYLKETAKRATWLGNDETHYSRIWRDHDLEDLKRLIHLTIAWLHNALITEEFLKAMPEGPKRPE